MEGLREDCIEPSRQPLSSTGYTIAGIIPVGVLKAPEREIHLINGKNNFNDRRSIVGIVPRYDASALTWSRNTLLKI